MHFRRALVGVIFRPASFFISRAQDGISEGGLEEGWHKRRAQQPSPLHHKSLISRHVDLCAVGSRSLRMVAFHPYIYPFSRQRSRGLWDCWPKICGFPRCCCLFLLLHLLRLIAFPLCSPADPNQPCCRSKVAAITRTPA